MANADRPRVVVYPSESVVVDGKGRRMLAFPTEREADEYLEGLRGADCNADIKEENRE